MRRAALLAVLLAGACRRDDGKQPHLKGHLGTLRSALSIYYTDNEGRWPSELAALIPRYLAELPATELPEHPPTRQARSGAPADTGLWLYDARTGAVSVDCTHADPRGRRWSEF